MRCSSTLYSSYWWPRRKLEGRSQGGLLTTLSGKSGRRGYNNHREERKVYNFPKGFEIVQSFPARNAEFKMRKTSRPDPPPKKRKSEIWTLGDLASYRDHFAEEDVAMLKPDSDSSPARQAIAEPKDRPPKSESEKNTDSDISDRRRASPQQSIATASADNLDELPVDERTAEVEQPAQDKLALSVAGEVSNQAEVKTRPDHVQDEGSPNKTVFPGPTNLHAAEGTDILGEPDMKEELQSIRIAPTLSNLDLDPAAIPNTPQDPQGVHVAEFSSPTDTNPEITSHEYDEELERALQHFNLGAWDRPWRPWPPKRAVDQLEKEDRLQKEHPETSPREYDEEVERALQHFNLGAWDRPWRPWPPKRSEHELEKKPERELSKQFDLQEEAVEFNRTIHILGLGTAGKYIAHSLAGLSNGPPITLLMHRPLIMQQWHDEGAAIRVLRNGEFHVQTGFHIESSANFQRQDPMQRFPGFGRNLEHSAEPPTSAIDTLVVTTDGQTTVPALSSIKHRLRKSTTICFIQDGLGIIEKINKVIFPNSQERPTYILGRMSHKLASTDRHFTIEERKVGDISCSKFPKVVETNDGSLSPDIIRKDFSWSPQAKHLVGSLLRAPTLNTKPLGHKSFLVTQLEKLIVGAVIGPLSVAFDCSNDKLLYNYSVSQNMKYLLREISCIVQSFPELATIHDVPKAFSVERLEKIVLSCIKTTGKNISPMLQDVRAGKKTDIDFYNGYLVMRAKELRIAYSENRTLLHLVKGKQAVKSREKNSYIPFRDEGRRLG